MSIVMEIYQQAQAPLYAQLIALMNTVPFPGTIYPNSGGGDGGKLGGAGT
jgi:hypothetical protein